MKKFVFSLVLISLFWVEEAFARTCEETVYDICIRQERDNSDASRGYVSKEEFCRAVAALECTIGES